ncbi:MAG: response regulator transcription factor [Achromobacter pulmonis]|uniref:Transcriptional regulatory protein OmpR n=1 Tax=Achromobacter pulmonis TaxID=1389932 RepID=A0A6S7BW17_9BURK|nr:response regulator transcription factor [Achromobacter pulmonis]MCF7770241.1 DNA-binding response regulator [Achromobacter pulmonis]MPT26933.1 response regulator transcription factor [Achromobacter sp.]CAB3683043.1 Transcriptional regulatory protein OmpR [Achromobacter pulmonis]CAB3821109.1 Transcriptional regulatory protein OmpR [Achromobacter pulmonis]
MNDLLDLIVFSPDSRQRALRSDALAGMGFSPRACEDSNGLFRLFQARRTPLLVMEAELTDLCMAVAGLRAMDTTAGIVAVSTFDSPENRILGLHCGADACFPPDVASAEIAAALQALVRRVPLSGRRPAEADSRASVAPPAEPNGKWQFQDAAWTLVSPRGKRLALTQAERDFLLKLTASPDKRMPRGDVLAGDPQTGRESLRRTDVVVSRLRRKAQETNMELPIRTVWGWGYAFTGDI